jgi:hypothetical protein
MLSSSRVTYLSFVDHGADDGQDMALRRIRSHSCRCRSFPGKLARKGLRDVIPSFVVRFNDSLPTITCLRSPRMHKMFKGRFD